MTVESLSSALLWCAVINYTLILVWAVTYRLGREQVHRLWGGWFRLSGEQFDSLSFTVMGVYKVGILLFNLVPYVALQLVR